MMRERPFIPQPFCPECGWVLVKNDDGTLGRHLDCEKKAAARAGAIVSASATDRRAPWVTGL